MSEARRIITNDFTVQNEAAPVFALGYDRDFGTWNDGSPVLEIDEGDSGIDEHRRVAIF